MTKQRTDWQAHWLWAPGWNQRYRRYANTYAFFRLVVELPATPAGAVVRLTADARYRLWVNGEHVLRGPARGYQRSYPYDELDLAPWLREGSNVLGILAHCIGDNTFSSEFDTRPGVLLDGAAVMPNGLPVRLDTHPSTWTTWAAECYRQEVHRSSVQTGWQEDCDLRRWPVDWLRPDGATEWPRPVDLGPHPQPPWHQLEPRGIPLLTETERRPEPLTCYVAEAAEGWETVTDLSAPLVTEAYRLEAAAAKPEGEWWQVPPASGRAVAVLYDLGLTCLGHTELVVEAADGVVDLAYAERLLPNGFVATRPPEDTQPRHVDRFRLRPGEQKLAVFNPRGYRYLAVIVRGNQQPVRLGAPVLREVNYPAAQRGRLATGEERLDRVWEIGLATLRRNMTDAYTDCPWREQAQWWGDARVEFLINAYTLGDTALLARGIRQCAQSMLPNGLMYGVFPSKAAILPDYNFVWAETLWDHYWHTGSDALLRQWAEALRRNLAWFREHTDENGLLAPPDGTWLFLDWAPLYRGRYSTVYNLRYLQALATAAQIFNQVGDAASADACIGRGMLTALSLTQHVFDPETGLWHDGFDPAKGERLEQISAHAQALAILLGLEPQSHDYLCQEVLIPTMLQQRDDVVAPSPFFSAFVLEALMQRGYLDEVVEIIRHRWGAWLDQGHRTWPEEWDPSRQWNLSLCHAWSGAPTWLLSVILLGVRPVEAGWSRILLAPRPAGLTKVSGSVPAPQGEVQVEWTVHNNIWEVNATLPPGMEAVVDLGDGERRTATTGKHRWEVDLY
ncbi:MAG: hypothetical protein HUU35_06465 [Armatimonadetes bacterium]|nr:hypothetical protein [Armatimonadota bacterium]